MTSIKRAHALAGAVVALLLGGCETIGFYAQAVGGQWSVLSQRRPLTDVIADPATDPGVRRKLILADDVRKFAETELDLPVDDAYATYVDVGRPYAVWSVYAAPEFEVTLEEFCYPIAGCVGYRGYFDQEDAHRFAQEMRRDGFDVFVGGVAAYSTLGWFDDPILSTFIRRSDTRFAALIFHELAHRAVYVPGETRFNESFATTVERSALDAWLTRKGNPERFDQYIASQQREEAVIRLIAAARDELANLYDQSLSASEMRARKQEVIEELRENYQTLQASWGGHDEFSAWMEGDINNARLATLGVYNDWVPAFRAILAENGNDFSAFVAAVRKLAKMERKEREARLDRLLAEQRHAD